MKGDSTATYTFRGVAVDALRWNEPLSRAARPAGGEFTRRPQGGRAQSCSPPDTRPAGHFQWGYAATGFVGCTREKAGAPDGSGVRHASKSTGWGWWWRKAERGGASARRGHATIPAEPNSGPSCLPSWQRAGRLPLQPSARPPPNDCVEMEKRADAPDACSWHRGFRTSARMHARWSAAALWPSHALWTRLGVLHSEAPLFAWRWGHYRLNWNVGLDYTAHRANCQSARVLECQGCQAREGVGWGWVGPNAVRRPGLACASSGTFGGCCWLRRRLAADPRPV